MDVDEVITALKSKVDAATDADLARKLRIDKSTISSWRSRGNVPQRFLAILRGESHQFIGTPPQKWGEHENVALGLALFRLGRLLGKKTDFADYRTALELFSGEAGIALWLMMIDAQKDIAARQEGQSLKTAFALTLYDDVELGDLAIKRDNERLAKALPSGWSLPEAG